MTLTMPCSLFRLWCVTTHVVQCITHSDTPRADAPRLSFKFLCPRNKWRESFYNIDSKPWIYDISFRQNTKVHTHTRTQLVHFQWARSIGMRRVWQYLSLRGFTSNHYLVCDLEYLIRELGNWKWNSRPRTFPNRLFGELGEGSEYYYCPSSSRKEITNHLVSKPLSLRFSLTFTGPHTEGSISSWRLLPVGLIPPRTPRSNLKVFKSSSFIITMMLVLFLSPVVR